MTVIHDDEFGDITVRRNKLAKNVTIRLGTDGKFIISAPKYAPVFYLKSIVSGSRALFKDLASHNLADMPYDNGQQVGKEHSIAIIRTEMIDKPTVSITKNVIIVKLRPYDDQFHRDIQEQIREHIITALRREAKRYLPGRLAQLAELGDFTYDRVRFSHAAGRWGSCSTRGTISLNIALMTLPDTLIDYVLVHELCHTQRMNHSTAFWELVGCYDPHYRLHKRQIKRFTPNV